ncbi:hypothetical protein [cyanobacterium endosymbiont of Rhopalodia gibberula]|nr:hypothetical protein [cyanobacterium endosymbiont of Rhopalodia gibberula]
MISPSTTWGPVLGNNSGSDRLGSFVLETGDRLPFLSNRYGFQY